MTTLVERVLHLHVALGDVPHAFGGAIALAYCTGEPRGTRDIDVNVFVTPESANSVFRSLPGDVRWAPEDIVAAERDGQVRLWWDETPIDLFFDQHSLHPWARDSSRVVPFGGSSIPVLGCTTLAVLKALFNRSKDWADLEEMLAAETLDRATALGWLVQIIGPEDARVRRLLELRPSE